MFSSVTTDGLYRHFDVKRNYALDFMLQEALQMTVSNPGKLPGLHDAAPPDCRTGGEPDK